MKKKGKLVIYLIMIVAFLLIVLGCSWLYLAGPVSTGDNEDIEVEITNGTSTSKIGEILKEKNLIKSSLLFKVYIKLNHVSSLKAATYKFNRGMNLEEIIKVLEKGSTYNPNVIKITFKEGLRITDYINEIAKNTNHSEDEVKTIINDKTYIQALINKYWFLTDSILSEGIYYPLEGYLAPETYHFDNKDVEVKDIIETMLDEMDKILSKYKNSMINHDIHYYMTMASIVELEGTNSDNRKMIVGIFENRLNSRMNLGSDVTTYYGLQVSMTRDLSTDEFSSVNLYNTRLNTMVGKMPIGPICSPSESSIDASINPSDSEYLFFVADKNGKVYYTKTMKEHEKMIAEIKAKGDWIW